MTEKAEHRAMVLMELESRRISPEAALADLACTPRHLRRLRERFRGGGAVALNHGNLGRVPWHAVDAGLLEKVVALAREERYAGTNFHQYTEFLAEREGIVVSRPVVHRALTAAGIGAPKPQKRRARHRQRRERSAAEGHMLQLDGSLHKWVPHLPKFCILCGIDDATGKIWLKIRPTEDIQGYMELLEEICTTVGLPRIAYTDGFTSFGANRRFTPKLSTQDKAQLKRLLKQLGIHHIKAGSPEAKGRVERSFLTLQDRLISHLRADQVQTMADVERSLAGYVRNHNLRFTHPPHTPEAAWRPWPELLTPVEVFCLHDVRTVRNDNTVSFRGLIIDLPPAEHDASRRKQRVDVLLGFGGTITVKHGVERLALVFGVPPKIRNASKPAPKPDSHQITSADRIPELLADRI